MEFEKCTNMYRAKMSTSTEQKLDELKELFSTSMLALNQSHEETVRSMGTEISKLKEDLATAKEQQEDATEHAVKLARRERNLDFNRKRPQGAIPVQSASPGQHQRCFQVAWEAGIDRGPRKSSHRQSQGQAAERCGHSYGSTENDPFGRRGRKWLGCSKRIQRAI